MAQRDRQNVDSTSQADYFTGGASRANVLSGTFPPSLATLRRRAMDWTYEHPGMDWAAIRAAHTAEVHPRELERLEEQYQRDLENDRRRS